MTQTTINTIKVGNHIPFTETINTAILEAIDRVSEAVDSWDGCFGPEEASKELGEMMRSKLLQAEKAAFAAVLVSGIFEYDTESCTWAFYMPSHAECRVNYYPTRTKLMRGEALSFRTI